MCISNRVGLNVVNFIKRLKTNYQYYQKTRLKVTDCVTSLEVSYVQKTILALLIIHEKSAFQRHKTGTTPNMHTMRVKADIM